MLLSRRELALRIAVQNTEYVAKPVGTGSKFQIAVGVCSKRVSFFWFSKCRGITAFGPNTKQFGLSKVNHSIKKIKIMYFPIFDISLILEVIKIRICTFSKHNFVAMS